MPIACMKVLFTAATGVLLRVLILEQLRSKWVKSVANVKIAEDGVQGVDGQLKDEGGSIRGEGAAAKGESKDGAERESTELSSTSDHECHIVVQE